MVATHRSRALPGRVDPRVIGQFLRYFAPVVRRMWPASLQGLEHLPDHDRYMIVANHSGVGTAELWSMMLWWYERFGLARPLAAMAHPGGFRVPPIRHFLEGVGAVEATREGAERARTHGAPLLVFPGGDRESMRPLWRARQVDFGGRTGWVRLARDLGLEIVPLCITNSHRTNPVLAGGRAVAWMTGLRLLGFRRAPLTLLGAAGSAAAYAALRSVGKGRMLSGTASLSVLWAAAMLPWVPSRIGFRFLPPVGHPPRGVTDRTIYDRVVGALQEAMWAAE